MPKRKVETVKVSRCKVTKWECALNVIVEDVTSTNQYASQILMPLFYTNEISDQGRGLKLMLMTMLKFRQTHVRSPNFYEEWIDRYLSADFYSHFRMLRSTAIQLVKCLGPMISITGHLGGTLQVTTEKQVLISLWYLAKGDTMISTGDRFNVVPSTVYNCVTNVVNALCLILKRFIFWPNEEESANISREFYKMSGFPDVIGAIDGSHIQCVVPSKQQDSYQDRTFNHSIQIQAVATHNKVLTNIFVGFPGSVHDARVLNESPIYKKSRLKLFYGKYHLVGDSAYPCLTWLMTPYAKNSNVTRAQKNYNYTLSKARVVIENVFALLKNRWRILKFVNVYYIKRVISIIVACCVLHNFCLLHQDELNLDENENMENNEPPAKTDSDRQGFVKRNQICDFLMQNAV